MKMVINRRVNPHFDFPIWKRIFPKSKHSQGHVEMILSLVLFVGFLIFIFLFLNPLSKGREVGSINKVEIKILESISSEMGKLSVIVNTNQDCYDLRDVDDIYGNNFVEIVDSSNPRRFTIYYGDFFDNNLIGKISCSNRVERNYMLGLYNKENIVVYSKVRDFNEKYESNYNSLKESLGIGDFSILFKDLEGEIILDLSVEKIVPENVEVVSKDIVVRIIDNRANINEVVLNIKTWA